MRWPQVVIAILATIVVLIGDTKHAGSADLPAPPVPRKSLPAWPGSHETALAGDLAPSERVQFYHDQAIVQGELESSHRAAASASLSKLGERTAADRLSVYFRAEADREEMAAKYHNRLKNSYLDLEADPTKPFRPDLPPLPTARGQEEDRAVLEAVLKDLLDQSDAAEQRPGARREFVLNTFSLSDTMPGDFDRVLDGVAVSKKSAMQLKSDLARRNAGGPTTFGRLKFKDARIVIKDLNIITDASTGERLFEMNPYEFREKYPNIEYYAETYLPGFSEDGKTALVRMTLGPPSDTHGLARYTGVVGKSQGEWKIKWSSITLRE